MLENQSKWKFKTIMREMRRESDYCGVPSYELFSERRNNTPQVSCGVALDSARLLPPYGHLTRGNLHTPPESSRIPQDVVVSSSA